MELNMKKVKVGREFKSYKALCEVLGVKPKAGDSKRKHIKDFKKYFEWEMNGYAFKITKVFNKPRDGSKGVTREQSAEEQRKFRKAYTKLAISYKLKNRAGVYIIRKGKEIYIGSTINFLNRYRQHNSRNNPYASGELLGNGGSMKILWLYEGEETNKRKLQKIIRAEEIRLIKEYILKDEFIVLNIDFNDTLKYKVNPKSFSAVYIRNEDIVKTMDVLNSNDIEFKINRKGE